MATGPPRVRSFRAVARIDIVLRQAQHERKWCVFSMSTPFAPSSSKGERCLSNSPFPFGIFNFQVSDKHFPDKTRQSLRPSPISYTLLATDTSRTGRAKLRPLHAVVTPLLTLAMTRWARARSCLSRLPSRATRARVLPRQAEIAARLAA
jgi:hypothetical protein